MCKVLQKSYRDIVFEIDVEGCQKIGVFVFKNWKRTSSVFFCKGSGKQVRRKNNMEGNMQLVILDIYSKKLSI